MGGIPPPPPPPSPPPPSPLSPSSSIPSPVLNEFINFNFKLTRVLLFSLWIHFIAKTKKVCGFYKKNCGFSKFNGNRILLEANFFNFDHHKPSLESCEVPQKNWAGSVELFWRLLDTNKHTVTSQASSKQSTYM